MANFHTKSLLSIYNFVLLIICYFDFKNFLIEEEMTAKTDTASTGTDTLNEENRSGDSSGKGDVNNSEKLDSISN